MQYISSVKVGSRLGLVKKDTLAQNFELSLVSDIKKSDNLALFKKSASTFLGLVVNFHKSIFLVSVSSQKIGLVPP